MEMGGLRCSIALGAIGLVFAAGCETFAERSVEPAATARAQMPRPASSSSILQPPASLLAGQAPLPNSTPAVEASETPLPINLATALQLANARPLDVQIAGSLVAAAAAELARARVLLLPNLDFGADNFQHLGPQQTSAGTILTDNRNSLMVGLGPNVIFSFSDAVYAPLAARQDLRAREAIHQASRNDASLAVTEAYFGVQQARGELASANLAVKYAEDVASRTQSLLTKGLTAPSEVNRANTELGHRKQVVSAAREHWRTASAELARILRLDPSSLVAPLEPPFLPVTVIDPTVTVDSLIPIALTTRPELAEHQAVVQATLTRLKQEKLRPLIPSLAVRGVSTSPTGSLGYGLFGGGVNGTYSDFSGRFDIDMQLMWEFQSLGFGNAARVRERKAEYQAATLDLLRTQDRIAAEVVTAFAQARSAAERANYSEPALREGIELANKTVVELGQTRRIGDSIVLLLRPQEAVAAVQAFAQASQDFFGAIADYNRAQFRLYRALGHPAHCLANALPEGMPARPLPNDKPAQLPEVEVVPKMEMTQLQLPEGEKPRQEIGGISVSPLQSPAPPIIQTTAPSISKPEPTNTPAPPRVTVESSLPGVPVPPSMSGVQQPVNRNGNFKPTVTLESAGLGLPIPQRPVSHALPNVKQEIVPAVGYTRPSVTLEASMPVDPKQFPSSTVLPPPIITTERGN